MIDKVSQRVRQQRGRPWTQCQQAVKWLVIVALAIGPSFVAGVSPVFAQATRTWVSGVGDDANPCSRTAPCKTFAGAISKTATAGEISVLDPGGYGAITITKSITLDGTGTLASILHAGTNGVVVNVPGSDANGLVRLRNLAINGGNSGFNGIKILSAKAVVIENVTVFGSRGNDPNGRGLTDERGAGGTLAVADSSFTDNSRAGIVVVGPVNAQMNNVQVHRNGSGISAANSAQVTVSHSFVSGNTTGGGFGILVQVNGTDANIENTVVSGNGTGVTVQNGSSTARLSNTTVIDNLGAGLTAAGGGVFNTFGDNSIGGNGGGNSFPGGTVTINRQ